MKTIKGLAMHVHHNILFEYCYDYNERVNAIKTTKPEKEQKIRLKLFKMLPKEAIAELPENILKAVAECNKAWAEWDKVVAEWDKTRAEWNKARAECNKAWAEYDKARAEWDKAGDEWDKVEAKVWHKKYCGCKEWRNDEINFK